MATILAIRTLGTSNLYEVDTNPSVSGINAPVGSFCLATDGSGFFYKAGIGNTEWEQAAYTSAISGQNILYVNKNPQTGEFASIKAAVDSITSESNNSEWVVDIGPGLYVEDTITLRPYIHLRGAGRLATIIQVNASNKNVVIGARCSEIRDLSFDGATDPGYAGVYFSNDTIVSGEAYKCLVHACSFRSCDILIHVVGGAATTLLIASELVKEEDSGNYTTGFLVENAGSSSTILDLKNSLIRSSSSTTVVCSVTGNSQIILASIIISRITSIGQTAIEISNGGEAIIIGADIRNHTIGILMNSGGNPTIISAEAVNLTSNTQDIVVNDSNGTGYIDGIFSRAISYINPSSTVVLQGLDRQILRVSKLDTDYQSIAQAVASITDSSVTKRYTILVGPGTFIEPVIDLTSKPYVNVIGSSIQSTVVMPDANNHHIFNLGANCELSFMWIQGAGAGYAGIAYLDQGSFAQVHKLTFYDCDIGILITSVTQDTYFYGEYVDYNRNYSYGTKVISSGGFIAYANLENYYNFPTVTKIPNTLPIGTYVSGTESQVYVLASGNDTTSIGNPSVGGTAFYVDNGGLLNLSAVNIQGWTYGIHLGNVGSAPMLEAFSTNQNSNITYDLFIEHPSSDGSYQGSAIMSKVINNSIEFILDVQDYETDELNISNAINIVYSNGTITNISTLIGEASTMGVLEGGDLTSGGGLRINISDGYGYFEQFPDDDVDQRIDWGNFDGNVNTYNNTITYNTLVGSFSLSENITGGTSGATATVSTDNGSLLTFVWTNKKGFVVGETITGGTSLATAVILTVYTSILLGANVDQYIYFNSNGVLIANSSEPDTRYNILLGRVVTNATGIEMIDESPSNAEHTSNLISNSLKNAIGPVYSSGSIVTEDTIPLHLDVTTGIYYYGENVFTPSGGTNIIFEEIYGQGSGVINGQQAVSNTQYDNSGVLTNIISGNITYNTLVGTFVTSETITGGTSGATAVTVLINSTPYYVKHSLYLIGSGINEKYYLVYGQNEYNTLLAAQQGNIPSVPSYFRGSMTLIAGIIVQQGNPNIVQIIDERPTIGFRVSSVNASADHLSLLNLNTGDAGHHQFLMLDGSKPMAGSLNMGTNSVVNAGSYNSVTVEAHESRHLPNGADPLITAAPTTNLSGTSTNSIGVQNSFSRSDHNHAITGAALSSTNDTNITVTLGGLFSTALLNAASLTLGWAGTLAVNRGGTGLSTFGGTNTLLFTTAANALSSIPTSNNGVVITSALGIPSISSTLPITVQTNITELGTITTGVWNGTPIANTYLSNASITIGSTAISLGSTVTTLAGLTSVTSTTFVGSLTGNASTATALQTARTINGVSFDGSSNITVTAAAGTLTGTTLNGTVVSSSLTSVGTITSGTWNGTPIANGNLANSSVTINGTSISLGSTVTITAAAGTLTGTTLNSTVISSSLTSVGTLTSGTWNATTIGVAYGGTGTSTTFTSGSIVFAGASGIYSQDNANLFYDSTNFRLGIKTNSPLKTLHVAGNARFEPVTGVTMDIESATVNTTDATVTTLQTIAIPTNTVMVIESRIQATKTGGTGSGTTGDGNGYIRTVKAKNVSGTVTIGTIQSSFTSEDISSFSINFVVSGANINLNVAGLVNDNITWTVSSIITK